MGVLNQNFSDSEDELENNWEVVPGERQEAEEQPLIEPCVGISVNDQPRDTLGDDKTIAATNEQVPVMSKQETNQTPRDIERDDKAITVTNEQEINQTLALNKLELSSQEDHSFVEQGRTESDERNKMNDTNVLKTLKETVNLQQTSEKQMGESYGYSSTNTCKGRDQNDTTEPLEHNKKTSQRLAGIFGAASCIIGDKIKDIDNKHDVRRRTANGLKSVGHSVLHVSKTIGDEVGESARTLGRKIETGTSKFKDDIQRAYIERDIEQTAKNATEKIKIATQKAGQKARRFNEDYHVAETVTAAAVVGAGLFFAKGNVRAGATALATGGALYMAGEAMKEPYRHDNGLNERIHLD